MWSKNQILASIKGRKSVANLRYTTINNTNIDLVNDDVYTKFGLIMSIQFGGRTGLVVRASDSGSGDPGSILGRVGVLFP